MLLFAAATSTTAAAAAAAITLLLPLGYGYCRSGVSIVVHRRPVAADAMGIWIPADVEGTRGTRGGPPHACYNGYICLEKISAACSDVCCAWPLLVSFMP
jgi:hypothetical protein